MFLLRGWFEGQFTLCQWWSWKHLKIIRCSIWRATPGMEGSHSAWRAMGAFLIFTLRTRKPNSQVSSQQSKKPLAQWQIIMESLCCHLQTICSHHTQIESIHSMTERTIHNRKKSYVPPIYKLELIKKDLIGLATLKSFWCSADNNLCNLCAIAINNREKRYAVGIIFLLSRSDPKTQLKRTNAPQNLW